MRYHLLRAINRYKYNLNQNRPNTLSEQVLCFDRKDIEANDDYNNKDNV